MVELTFRTSNTNVPILSKKDLDDLGELIVADYRPEAMQIPQAIDVDHFLERYLGATMDYKYLSHCGLYLGMTVFEDTDRIPVFNHDKFCAEFIQCTAGTIIIDNDLLDPTQEHRYRFTAMHEGSHLLLHHQHFRAMAKQRNDYIPLVQCRVDTAHGSRQSGYKRTDKDWIEWQANSLASAILMPRRMVVKAVREAEQHRLSVNAGLEAVIDTFNVSSEAAVFRMQELGLVRINKR